MLYYQSENSIEVNTCIQIVIQILFYGLKREKMSFVR